jgi:hypothetical protein
MIDIHRSPKKKTTAIEQHQKNVKNTISAGQLHFADLRAAGSNAYSQCLIGKVSINTA